MRGVIKMDPMRNRTRTDPEMMEAVLTLTGLVVIAFALLFGGIALVEWLVGTP